MLKSSVTKQKHEAVLTIEYLGIIMKKNWHVVNFNTRLKIITLDEWHYNHAGGLEKFFDENKFNDAMLICVGTGSECIQITS